MDTTRMLQELLDVLLTKTDDGSVEWTVQSENVFALPVGSGTVLLSSLSNVLTFSTAIAGTLSTTQTPDLVVRLAVFNPNGVEVGAITSNQVSKAAGVKLTTLYETVKQRALDADRVIGEVIGEVRTMSPKKAERDSEKKTQVRRTS